MIYLFIPPRRATKNLKNLSLRYVRSKLLGKYYFTLLSVTTLTKIYSTTLLMICSPPHLKKISNLILKI